MKATKEIDIYLIKKRNVRVIDVVQYDTGIQLVFTVKDFDIPSGATATLYVQKPSGKFVYQEDEITIAGNTITIDLENQAITEHGKVPYQVSITSGSDVITTFTGLMMVEKSMKDANATESTTVVRAFDEAVADHVAEFQTKAELIVAACIATIPDDYTTMEAKVNELANAVKCELSGGSVFAGDVSAVEHEPVVKVHGKNIMIPNTQTFTSNGYTITLNDDGSVTITGSASSTNAIYLSVALRIDGTTASRVYLKKGQKYIITAYKDGELSSRINTKTLYADGSTLWRTANTWHTADDYTQDRAIVQVYLQSTGHAVGDTSLCGTYKVQMELGETATDYEAYIDPSTIAVHRYGKNLLHAYESRTQNGYTITKNDDGSIKVTGASDTDGAIYLNLGDLSTYPVYLDHNKKYSLTWKSTNGRKLFMRVEDREGNKQWISNTAFANVLGTGYDWIRQLYIQIGASTSTDPNAVGDTSLCGTYYFQLEQGIEATEFEAFKEPTVYIPSSDGTVSGVTSLSPSMTIFTDTVDAIVDCEYNVDTKTYIDNRKDDDAPPIVCNATGAVIAFSDSAERPLQSLTIYGKTTQDGTPTPDAPVALESVGDSGSIGVSVCGKNLLDVSNAVNATNVVSSVSGNGVITIIGNLTAKWSSTYLGKMRLIKGRTYTVSGTLPYFRIGICKSASATPSNSNYPDTTLSDGMVNILNATYQKRTFTANETTDAYFWLCTDLSNTGAAAEFTFTLQAEEGATATEYETYVSGGSATALTPNGLPGIPVSSGGNYTDESGQQWMSQYVDMAAGETKGLCKRIIVDGENVTLALMSASTTNTQVMVSVRNNNYDTTAKALCNYLPYANGLWSAYAYYHMFVCADSAGSYIRCYVPTSWGTTAAELNAYAKALYEAGTPLEFIVPLIEPETISTLTADELAQYAALHTNYPNTTVYNDSGAGMKLEYVADTKTYIDNNGGGEGGYTPVKGVDYWTDEDIAEIQAYVDDAILGGAW